MFKLNLNHKKIRDEFRVRSKKRFNFLHMGQKNRKKNRLDVLEAMSFKRAKVPIKK